MITHEFTHMINSYVCLYKMINKIIQIEYFRVLRPVDIE